MLHILIQVLVTAVAVLVAARIVPGIRVKSFGSAVVFAVVLGVLGVLLHTLLVILALPFILLTLGLFLLVINGFLFWLADKVVAGVEVDGFGAAILGSLVTSGVSWLVFFLLHRL
ncbi:MAG TPA: phage holin family protein [Polyangia bacterium]